MRIEFNFQKAKVALINTKLDFDPHPENIQNLVMFWQYVLMEFLLVCSCNCFRDRSCTIAEFCFQLIPLLTDRQFVDLAQATHL